MFSAILKMFIGKSGSIVGKGVPHDYQNLIYDHVLASKEELHPKAVKKLVPPKGGGQQELYNWLVSSDVTSSLCMMTGRKEIVEVTKFIYRANNLSTKKKTFGVYMNAYLQSMPDSYLEERTFSAIKNYMDYRVFAEGIIGTFDKKDSVINAVYVDAPERVFLQFKVDPRVLGAHANFEADLWRKNKYWKKTFRLEYPLRPDGNSESAKKDEGEFKL